MPSNIIFVDRVASPTDDRGTNDEQLQNNNDLTRTPY